MVQVAINEIIDMVTPDRQNARLRQESSKPFEILTYRE
jgi:hypothetical protein